MLTKVKSTRKRVAVLVCAIYFACSFYPQAAAQEKRRTKIRFEMDGKPTVAAKEIEFYDGSRRLLSRSPVKNGSFEMPSIRPLEKVDVHIKLKGRTLVFDEIYGTKFETDWTVGIDRRPFSDAISWTVPENMKPKEIWFIRFDPHDGDGTIVTVFVK
jgi:hypothetical protein